MPCFHPLTAWRGERGSSGLRSVVFKAGEALPGLVALPQCLPCGQCFGCRLDYSYDWAVRCTCEAQMHKENCMILLTYENVPDKGSLDLRDWQLFMRRLREVAGPVRYFHAGEYGDKNGRPHDHALLFGYDFRDKKYFKKSASGHKLYRSDLLEGMWSRGHCTIGEVSFESAGYLARYLMGKPTLTKQIKDDSGVVVGRSWTEQAVAKYGEEVDKRTGEVKLVKRPEYLTMSRAPGIGKLWFDKFWSDIYPQDCVVLRSGSKMPPPRYFDNLYSLKNPVDMERIKLHRISRCTKKEEVWNKFLHKFQLLDVARDERLSVMEGVLRAKLELFNSERGALI